MLSPNRVAHLQAHYLHISCLSGHRSPYSASSSSGLNRRHMSPSACVCASKALEVVSAAFSLQLKWGPIITFTQRPTSKRKSLNSLDPQCLRTAPALASTLPRFIALGSIFRRDTNTDGQARKFEQETRTHCPLRGQLSACRP